MPTNEERREAARSMREKMEAGWPFTGEGVVESMGIDEYSFDNAHRFYEAAWSCLADLIEPVEEESAPGPKDGTVVSEASQKICDLAWDLELRADEMREDRRPGWPEVEQTARKLRELAIELDGIRKTNDE